MMEDKTTIAIEQSVQNFYYFILLDHLTLCMHFQFDQNVVFSGRIYIFFKFFIYKYKHLLNNIYLFCESIVVILSF